LDSKREILIHMLVRDDSDVAMARLRVRELATARRMSEADAVSLMTAVSELARNIVVHAGNGEVLLGIVTDGERTGLLAIAQDDGPGVPNVGDAMRDGFSTRGGLGLGLPSARRLVDDFEIQSGAGRGTSVTLIKWVQRSTS